MNPLLRKIDQLGVLFKKKALKTEKAHFSILAFFVVAGLVFVSIRVAPSGSILAWSCFSVSTLIATCSDFFYFRRYSPRLTSQGRGMHRFEIFRYYWLTPFTVIFIFLVSQWLLLIHQKIFPMASGTLEYEDFAKHCFWLIGNNLCFGGLAIFELDSWQLAGSNKDARWMFFLVGAFFQLIILAALLKELLKLFIPYANRLVRFEFPPEEVIIDPTMISDVLLSKICARVDSGDYSNNFEANSSMAVFAFATPECRTVFNSLPSVHEISRSLYSLHEIFTIRCKDHRFRRYPQRSFARIPRKKQWIEEFNNKSGITRRRS